ncbi:MAG: DNA polymerase III subunit gamma/tau [Bacteriovoracia bacterium]
MSSYVVLARKWRSSQFADIVGQSHIVRTLMNAIRAERIHQAYLFTGSRGIGKTSIARIFAKVIRCPNAKMVDGWLRSCDECSNCKEITASTSVDVIEIDGASNNGVDAVREIRENVKYLPASGSRKIYIIDEVHMLTTAAFNALLKTLEEPPPHVIFIFATTESHKIPATILSRCQRFDYKRITIAQIQKRLTEIAAAEKMKADPAALIMIAQAAEGSMRDALSLLDQVIAFSGQNITVESVQESIGLIETQTVFGILRGILGRKPLEALAQVERTYSQGHDLRVLARSLIEGVHQVILAKIDALATAGFDFTPERQAELKSLSELRELEEMELIFQALHHGAEWVARSSQPKVVMDILIIKCATAEALVEVGAATGHGSPGGTGLGTKSPAATTGAPPRGMSAAPSSPAQEGPSVTSTPAVSATPNMTLGASAAPAVSPAAAIRASLSAQMNNPAPAKPASVAANAAPKPAATPVSTATGPTSWAGFIDSIRQVRPLLASLLEHASHAEVVPTADDKKITLKLQFVPEESYKHEQVMSRNTQNQLSQLAQTYFGKPAIVESTLNAAAGESIAHRKEREQKKVEDERRTEVNADPIIREAKALFGGELGPIEFSGNKKQ